MEKQKQAVADHNTYTRSYKQASDWLTNCEETLSCSITVDDASKTREISELVQVQLFNFFFQKTIY